MKKLTIILLFVIFLTSCMSQIDLFQTNLENTVYSTDNDSLFIEFFGTNQYHIINNTDTVNTGTYDIEIFNPDAGLLTIKKSCTIILFPTPPDSIIVDNVNFKMKGTL